MRQGLIWLSHSPFESLLRQQAWDHHSAVIIFLQAVNMQP